MRKEQTRRRMARGAMLAIVAAALAVGGEAHGATRMDRYYAHPTVEDEHGVIAPWYTGLNGQFDYRVRIAAETLKRYPWTEATHVARVPAYVFSGGWQIAADGTITVRGEGQYADGDLGQRAAYVLLGLVDYYRYAGDPAALAHITLAANALLDFCLTPADHPWPDFLVSVPTKGLRDGKVDPNGMIQLDIAAEVGLGLLRAYQILGNARWIEAAQHWGDLLAMNADLRAGVPPWGRYANPEAAPWPEDRMTGGVAFILVFLDELIRLGYAEPHILAARDAGRAYLRDVLLPEWLGHDTWGGNYWDWPCGVQVENVTEFVTRYLMEHPEVFVNWRCDTRNIMGLFLNRTSVSSNSNGDVYSGAWAYPESSGCCGRSLWYGPMEVSTVFAEYGVLAQSEWGREMARRQQMLATYDVHATGVVEDNIDGGAVVAADWFKIAHPMALRHVLGTMAWLPDLEGANRENHIMRSSATVASVVYDKGRLAYATFDAPPNTADVLRLAYAPASIAADGAPLERRAALDANGFTVQTLSNGDCIVSVRHDGAKSIVVEGADPQQIAEDDALEFAGAWQVAPRADAAPGQIHVATAAEATCAWAFSGNQVRVLGDVGPDGGLADVYVDDVRQLVGVDAWNPIVRCRQVLYSMNGLEAGPHHLKLVARGAANPVSGGTAIRVDAITWADAAGVASHGSGGGPTEAQRAIFGYPGRADYVDVDGCAWRPATEVVIRAGDLVDSVAASWYTQRRRHEIGGTPDPELYRFGMHGPAFNATFTAGPGRYHVRLKFAEGRTIEPPQRAVTIAINGQEVVTDMDIAATAGGLWKAVDLVFNDIAPAHGVVDIQFTNAHGGEAMVQAIEIALGNGGTGATPVGAQASAAPPGAAAQDGNLLANPGFEEGKIAFLGAMGATGQAAGWRQITASPSQCYIWSESDYQAHPEWGLPEYHGGAQALRTHTEGNGHTLIYQDVAVEPKKAYVASAWVRAADLRGKGFGTLAGDSAGLVIQELDGKGAVVKTRDTVALTASGPFAELTVPFTTEEATRTVRFILDTVIAAPYSEGHVTYDDCALRAAP